MLTPRRTLGVAVVVLIALVAGLGWWLGSRDPSYADRDWSAMEPVAAAVPPVRTPDPAVTRDSLAALDACAVGAAGEPGATRIDGGPGTCTVHRSDGTVVVSTSVAYRLDESHGMQAINALDSRDRVEHSGVAMWVGPGPVSAGLTVSGATCAVVVPASLDLALAIVADSADCTAAEASAEAALADLDAVTATRPLPPACDLLAAVAPTEVLSQDVATCAGGDLTLTLGAAPLDEARLLGRPTRLGGADAREADDGRACAYEWPVGRDATGGPVRALLRGGPCARLRPLATRAVAAVATMSASTVTAPVFYGADEPDPGGVGGCAELGDQLSWLCAPARTRSLPDDPVDAIRSGEADPDALCTAALRSAKAAGRTMVAVTTAPTLLDDAARLSYDGPRVCTLLEPTDGPGDRDTTTIIVTASRDRLETVGNTAVAGHPAYHSKQASTWEIALTSPDERGYLRVRVIRSDTRGDRTEPAWAQAYVGDLVERLWS
ncbi:hypothetical protein ACFQ3F_04815 [Nocardioides ginsengisoli]|uniref:Uncharacterized protein n=1 Tax=Nocardioides ginsengisoli TaxID=363868 RepID=A0ABW3VY89_9ACTN